MSKQSPTATTNKPPYIGLVHWPLIGRLLRLVQRGGAWAEVGGLSPLLAVPNVIAHPLTAVYQLHIIRCRTIITLAH